MKLVSATLARVVLLLLALGVGSTPWARAQTVIPYTQVSAGSGFFSMALRADGTLWTWGDNYSGELGTGSTAAFLPTPQQVALPAGVAPGAAWVQCSAGSEHALGLTSDGRLWAWGADYGLLGTGNPGGSSARPVQVSTPAGVQWRSCAAGPRYSVAIRTDGTLWKWGFTPLSSGAYTSPSLVPTPAAAAAGTTWTSASAGTYHVLALRSDGTLWAWGDNTYGAVGDGTLTNRYAPVEVPLPAGAPAGARWVQVSTGRNLSLALLSTGTLYGWGDNERGALGLNPSTNHPVALPFPSGAAPGTQWQQVQAGTDHVLGLLTDGSLWTWGENVYGQLAINSQADSSVPVREYTSGTWVGISAGLVHTLAIGTDGGVYGAGAAIKAGYTTNQWNDGQLGDGTRNGALVLRRSMAVVTQQRPALAASFQLYPNPSHDWLMINNLPAQATVRLCTALGQVVRTLPAAAAPATATAFDVRGLPAGPYWLTVTSPGGAAQTRAVVVE